MTTGGPFEAAMTARTRCEWIKFRELLYGRRFPLRMNSAVYNSYVRPKYCMEVNCGI